MPMIDIYAAAGTFADKHRLAADAAGTVMRVEIATSPVTTPRTLPKWSP